MTWRPSATMKETTADKEAEKQAILFEDKVKSGIVSFVGSTRFQDYAADWMENTPQAPKTRASNEHLLKRINQAIGHIRLDRLQGHHLEAFYKNLAESGVNQRGSYARSDKLDKLVTKMKLSSAAISQMSGIGETTVSAARRGERISIKTAEKLCAALDIELGSCFDIHLSEAGLSSVTIHSHHKLISAILARAKRERIVPFNVAQEHITAPKLNRKEAAYLDEAEARRFLDCLNIEADIRKKTAFLILLFTGIRRGELCGLSWPDIDETNRIVNVNRASQYVSGRGVFEVPTKTAYSRRPIKVPAFVMNQIVAYRKWWKEQALLLAPIWKGQQERLFIQENGAPIHPDTINHWLRAFLKKHNLPHATPHSLRHTFATLQLAGGVDIRTLQSRTGHSQASTLLDVYAHALRRAQEAASDALETMLLPDSDTENKA